MSTSELPLPVRLALGVGMAAGVLAIAAVVIFLIATVFLPPAQPGSVAIINSTALPIRRLTVEVEETRFPVEVVAPGQMVKVDFPWKGEQAVLVDSSGRRYGVNLGCFGHGGGGSSVTVTETRDGGVLVGEVYQCDDDTGDMVRPLRGLGTQ